MDMFSWCCGPGPVCGDYKNIVVRQGLNLCDYYTFRNFSRRDYNIYLYYLV